MVHLAEKVRVVNGIRIEAGADQRPFVTYCDETRIDEVYIRGGDRDEATLIQFAPFKVCEVESLIVNNRAAETRTVLSLRGRNLGIGKGIGGVETLVSK